MSEEIPKYCPRCGPDPIGDHSDVELEEHDGVLFCNATGEGGCGFHFDIKERRRFRYEEKRFLWFWIILCLITFFHVHVEKRVYYDERP